MGTVLHTPDYLPVEQTNALHEPPAPTDAISLTGRTQLLKPIAFFAVDKQITLQASGTLAALMPVAHVAQPVRSG